MRSHAYKREVGVTQKGNDDGHVQPQTFSAQNETRTLGDKVGTADRSCGDEPINLREWKPIAPPDHRGRLFTCGRPGRGTAGYCRERKLVDDGVIDRWVNGLPNAEILHIVSLLGRKKSRGPERIGFSEFGYYPFRSEKEPGTAPTLQKWLDKRYTRRFVVHEFPTVDARGIPNQDLSEIKRCVLDLIESNNTVVVVDSAGAERTARVCEAVGFRK